MVFLPISKDNAELVLLNFYQKCVGKSQDFSELKCMIDDKLCSLDPRFPNYFVLKQAYETSVLNNIKIIENEAKQLEGLTKLDIKQENYGQVCQNIKSYLIRNTGVSSLDSVDDLSVFKKEFLKYKTLLFIVQKLRKSLLWDIYFCRKSRNLLGGAFAYLAILGGGGYLLCQINAKPQWSFISLVDLASLFSKFNNYNIGHWIGFDTRVFITLPMYLSSVLYALSCD